VAAIEACPTVTPNSTLNWIKSGSITRMLAADAKAAMDSNAMAKRGEERGKSERGTRALP
jgi:hypothetical protein